MPSPVVVAASAAASLVYISLPLFRLAVLCAAILFAAALAAAKFIAGGFGKTFCSIVLNPRALRLGLALVAGAAIGFTSIVMREQFSPGIPLNGISAIQGKLLDDPRSFANSFAQSPGEERGMAVLSLSGTESKDVRVSAKGRVTVYFSEGTMPRLKEFGRNAEIFAEGRFLPAAANNGAAVNSAGSPPRFAASSVHVTKAAPPLEQTRTLARSAVIARLKPKAWGGLAAALLLGTRENLEGELAESFRNAGLSHILALSGMHLAFLSAMLAFVLRRPLGKKASLAAGLAFIAAYVFLVGPAPSLVRAAIMYGMGALLVLSGTSRQSLVLLSGAFLVQILADPASPHTISFMLSYLALGGILLPGGAFLALFRGRIPGGLDQSLAASAAAFLVTAPVAAFFFGTLRPAGMAASLFAAPLSGLFMALSLLWLFAAELPLIGIVLDKLLTAVHLVLQWNVAFFARFPGLKVMTVVVGIITPLVIAGVFLLAKKQQSYRNEFIPFAL